MNHPARTQERPAPDVGPAKANGSFWKYSLAEQAVPFLAGDEFRVYYALLNFANTKTGTCYPAMGTIADRLGIAPRTVQKHVASLQRKKFLTVKSGKGARRKSGAYANNSYAFNQPENWLVSDGEPGDHTNARAYGHTNERAYGHTNLRAHGHTNLRAYKPCKEDNPVVSNPVTSNPDLSVTQGAAGAGHAQDSRHEESIQTTDSEPYGENESARKQPGNPASTSRPRESEAVKQQKLEEIAAVILSTLPGKKIPLHLLRDEVESLVTPECRTYAEVLHQARAYAGYLKRTGEEPAWRTQFFISGWDKRNWRNHADWVLQARQERETFERQAAEHNRRIMQEPEEFAGAPMAPESDRLEHNTALAEPCEWH
jgi:hypothetical protein